MKIIAAVAIDGVRALLHQRLLVALMLAAIALTIAFSVLMDKTRTNIAGSFASDEFVAKMEKSQGKELSETERRKAREQMESASSMFQAAFYWVVSVAGNIVALFIFSTAVSSEIRRGTIRMTLSKPVSRTQFIVGKCASSVAVMVLYAAISGLALLAFAQTQAIELNPAARWAPWLMFCEHLMLGSVAMLLSLFVHPLVAAVLAMFASNRFLSPPNPLYFILPSYSQFGVVGDVLTGTVLEAHDVAYLTLYAIDVSLIMLLLAVWRFRTKEIV